ncbi:hypothetical protein AJ87_16690 [Rhizobium yanglingense]|nr:hypothetical protein AJ87_16690 [Rhizobium yanglingense]
MTIADTEAVWPGAPAPETTPFARTASQLSGTGMDVDLGAVERPREPQSVRFIVKEGVRHVYISSLDELRQRLDLDETREAGVSEDASWEENKQPAQNKQPGTTANPPAKRPATRGSGPIEVENVHIEIDQAKLDRNVYQGSPRPPHRLDRISDIQEEAGNSSGSALLRRQEVRGAFGADIQALNAVIFEQAEAGSLDPMELNADVELLIGTLSERLAEDSSKAFLREFADLARDPLREDSARHDDADRGE